MVKYVVPLICCAGPALAHHEAVVASAIPMLAIWLFTAIGAFLAGRKLLSKDKK